MLWRTLPIASIRPHAGLKIDLAWAKINHGLLRKQLFVIGVAICHAERAHDRAAAQVARIVGRGEGRMFRGACPHFEKRCDLSALGRSFGRFGVAARISCRRYVE